VLIHAPIVTSDEPASATVGVAILRTTESNVAVVFDRVSLAFDEQIVLRRGLHQVQAVDLGVRIGRLPGDNEPRWNARILGLQLSYYRSRRIVRITNGEQNLESGIALCEEAPEIPLQLIFGAMQRLEHADRLHDSRDRLGGKVIPRRNDGEDTVDNRSGHRCQQNSRDHGYSNGVLAAMSF